MQTNFQQIIFIPSLSEHSPLINKTSHNLNRPHYVEETTKRSNYTLEGRLKGRGGYINIVNCTDYNLSKSSFSEYHMDAWNSAFPDSIPANSESRVYIKFTTGFFVREKKDSGIVIYKLNNSNYSFIIEATGQDHLHIQVTWSAGMETNFVVYPPLLGTNEAISPLGFDEEGTLSIVVAKNTTLQSPLRLSKTEFLQRWMEVYEAAITNKKIHELCLPATHDTGTYAIYSPVVTPWAQTQNKTILQQLQLGIRCLDLRTGYQGELEGDNKFIICHDVFRTGLRLKKVLEDVISFVKTNKKELVVLDFHRFVTFQGSFDYKELQSFIKATLGDYMVTSSYYLSTYSEIISGTSGRIIACFNHYGRESGFWEGINQHWYNVGSKTDLYSRIKQDMKNPPTGNRLWSICAICNCDPLGGIKPLSPELNNWFYAGSDFMQKANIVAVDFFNKTSIVDACIGANIIKGLGNESILQSTSQNSLEKSFNFEVKIGELKRSLFVPGSILVLILSICGVIGIGIYIYWKINI